jgi:NAD(P)-dependent dehydrogenase (short-subunit alcohol dehydrogenase family)
MSELRLDGQTFAVTGASRGIGREYVLLLAARGANVVVNSIGAGSAQRVADEITAGGGAAVAVQGDVGDLAVTRRIVECAIEEFGRIDGVVANAGVNERTRPFVDISAAELAEMIAVHVTGTWGLVQAAWPHLVEQNYGRVVLTTSQAGLFGMRDGAHYSAVKAAVLGLTRSLAYEARPHDIRLNAVAPIAATDMSDATLSPDRLEDFRAAAPAAFVASVVALLLHADCPVTGQVINCGAGLVNRVFVGATRGATFGLDAITPEAVADRFDAVMAEDGYAVPRTMGDIGKLLPPAPARATPR